MTKVLLIVALCCGPISVDAAVLKAATFGCQTERDAATAMGFQAKNDVAALKAFTTPKLASGACLAFGRGVAIDPESKKPPLTCVRLSGGLECYWLADSLIDLHPAEGGAERPGRAGGRHR